MGERVSSIDTVRAVAMAAIVAVHAKPFVGLGTAGNAAYVVVDALARFAVPFFFLTAGYLFAEKIARTDPARYVRAYVSRVASIYVFGLVLYAPLALVEAAGSAALEDRRVAGAVASRALEVASPVDLLYYGVSTTSLLWFLPALIVSIALVYLFERAGAGRYLLPVAVGLHAVGLLGEAYPMLLEVPVQTRDALFFGFCYTAIGFRLRSRGWTGADRRSRPYLLAFAACSALAVLERFALGYVIGDATLAQEVHIVEYAATTPLVSVSLFLFVLSRPDLGAGTRLPWLGRYAVGVYVVHPLILFSLLGASELLAMRGVVLQESILWHLWFAPFVYGCSLALYLAAVRLEVVDPAGSHVPSLGRVRRAVRTRASRAP